MNDKLQEKLINKGVGLPQVDLLYKLCKNSQETLLLSKELLNATYGIKGNYEKLIYNYQKVYDNAKYASLLTELIYNKINNTHNKEIEEEIECIHGDRYIAIYRNDFIHDLIGVLWLSKGNYAVEYLTENFIMSLQGAKDITEITEKGRIYIKALKHLYTDYQDTKRIIDLMIKELDKSKFYKAFFSPVWETEDK